MKCKQCGKWFQWQGDNQPEDSLCSECFCANFRHDIARRRRSVSVVSGGIVRRCKEIEKELPNSKDPATLRLERSELDGELEKMEATG